MLSVGVIGCGNICDIYLANAPRLGGYRVAACADLDPARARAAAERHGVARACTTDELLADPAIDLVLNLTPPGAHAPVALAAAVAGKHVYNEKPLTIDLADARRLLETARSRARLVGCAPDTFLGAGQQTCRRLVDEGAIGRPIAATAFMVCHGHESWHPDPAFYYQRGGGPLFDMGPYYLTALVNLLGPVRRVAALTGAGFEERVVTSEPRRGERIRVETPTHISATVEFVSGALATLVMSFDVWSHTLPCIEVYGSEGSLSVPDPNGFGGPVRLRRAAEQEWREIPLDAGQSENSRGLGVRDLGLAITERRSPRASGELALHILETMHAALESGRRGIAVEVESRPAQPAPMR